MITGIVPWALTLMTLGTTLIFTVMTVIGVTKLPKATGKSTPIGVILRVAFVATEMAVRLPLNQLATKTVPPSELTDTPRGEFPTVIIGELAPEFTVDASTTETVLPPLLDTYTCLLSGVTAIPNGLGPTVTVATTALVPPIRAVSITQTLPLGALP